MEGEYSDRMLVTDTENTKGTEMETYIFKVAPDYTSAEFHRGMTTITLDEWAGRTLEDFANGMKGRGFTYRTEEYTLSRGKFVEHIWERKAR